MLRIALALSALALVAAAPAHADTKTPPPPRGCVLYISGTGQYVYVPVGTIIEGTDGQGVKRRFKCTSSGGWDTALVIMRGEVVAPIGGTLELTSSGEIQVTPATVIG